MSESKNVIAELEKIADEVNPWKDNPPLRCDIPYPLLLSAIKLLKAQEPRVLTLEETEDLLDTVVWVDRPKLDNSSDEFALITAHSRKCGYVELQYPFCDKDYRERSDYVTYGKTWRCWDKRPTDEQRKAVKWDE